MVKRLIEFGDFSLKDIHMSANGSDKLLFPHITTSIFSSKSSLYNLSYNIVFI